ncbi:MAG: DUF371 domain-containing protein [Candidatus Woesearchaeota archaeon]
MKYTFYCKGHPHIRGTHRNTLEFTKDGELTLKGDCIVGVSADFNRRELEKFLSARMIQITITCKEISETVTCIPHKDFCSEHEMVIRISDFASDRTFGIRSNKGAQDLSRELISAMQRDEVIEVCVEDTN